MNKQVKRTVLLLIVAVILFATSMAFPAIQKSQFKDFLQGGALGCLIAGIISIVMLVLGMFKEKKA